jgi:type II secretory pathway predicted ATPase ExeA
MYESFFGLAKRPFTTMPDPACFVPIDGIYQAYSSLAQCAIDGRGIGVLTAPAGLGKTLICHRLAQELEARFTVVFLPTANFLTRRSLLQAILFELGHSYVRMGDQELRLALTSVIRRLRPGRGTIALIVDEAHLLAPRMLEELRALTNFSDAGESLLRLVISGQLSLEETLTQPAMLAFNQRVGVQTTLQPLTHDESAEYVSRRLVLAGANVTDIFSDDALLTICEASDGSPRCLNQLCDHSLLLSYLGSQKPVAHETVRDALDDLKQLPLTWNEPLTRRAPGAEVPRTAVVESKSSIDDNDAWIVTPNDDADLASARDDFGTVELGDAFETTIANSIEIGDPAVVVTTSTADGVIAPTAGLAQSEPIISATLGSPGQSDFVDEEIVIDRYAALDAALSRLTRTMLSARTISRRTDSIQSLPIRPGRASIDFDVEIESEDSAFDVVLPEASPNSQSPAASTLPELRSDDSPRKDAVPRPLSGSRYARLFSELRRRRIGA